MSEKNYKEFWIHNFPEHDVVPWDNTIIYKRYTNTHTIPDILPKEYTIHAIEYSAYQELKERERKLAYAIKQIIIANMDELECGTLIYEIGDFNIELIQDKINSAKQTLKDLGYE